MACLLHLNLSNNKIGDAGVRALAHSPHLARLRSLNLWNNCLSDESAHLLANSPCLAHLHRLTVSVSKQAMTVLAASANLPHLIDLQGEDFTSDECDELLRSYGKAIER